MKINLPVNRSSGYTIIEIIISLFILIMVFSVVQANYRQYIQRSSIDLARNQMISDIKLTREYALAGKKPTGCDNLTGYIFRAISVDSSYTITADCDTDVLIKTIILSDISKGTSIIGNSSVIFRVRGLGTDIATGGNRTFNLRQQTSSITRTVTVTSGGEIR